VGVGGGRNGHGRGGRDGGGEGEFLEHFELLVIRRFGFRLVFDEPLMERFV
jgi:hypothetical protein